MPPWVAPVIAAGAQLIGQGIQSWQANRQIKKMNEYNSPKSQMKRYQQAGLNAHLIYNQGSPGLQTQVAPTPQYGQIASDAVSNYNATRMADSQISANTAKEIKSLSDVSVNDVKRDLLERNPLMDDEYLNSLIALMNDSAKIKRAQSTVEGAKADWFTGEKSFKVDGVELHGPAGILKMETELKRLVQQFDLGAQDQQIKAQIIESKDFQNAILEVQKRWMTDADITPDHFVMFIKLLMQKF